MNTELRSPTSPRSMLLIWTGLSAVLVIALVLARLSAYGIWDPWELGVADAARKHAEGIAAQQPVSLSVRLVAASFAIFGPREWAGRLPLALSGILLLAATFSFTRQFAGRRAGIYAALVLASTPFFLLHSREMMGATPAFLAATLVMLGTSAAVFGTQTSGVRLAAWLGVALVGVVLGALGVGVLSTSAPALLAVAATALLTGRYRAVSGPQKQATFAVIGSALLVTGVLVRALLRHAATYSAWIGGSPSDGAIVTYERTIEHLFHGFAPWSAVLPVALASLLRASSAESPSAQPNRGSGSAVLGPLCMLWAALAYAAQSIFLSSYGSIAFIAPSALAAAVALWLREREEAEQSDLAELLVVLLLLGLVIRDFALYPASPFSGLELGETKVPEIFNPKRYWSALLGLFGIALLATSVAHEPGQLDLRAPYRGLRALWARGRGHQAWLVTFGLLLLGMLVFGILAFALPSSLKLTSLGARIGRGLMFVPIALPLAVAACQWLFHQSARLRRARSIPLLAAALLVGLYTSQIFQPQLSAHLSPRVVFDTYNKLAQPGEPLAQHQVEGRAAAFYAKGEVRDIAAQAELVDFLASGKRKWAAFPSDQLPEIDLAFRRRSGRHLFVPTLDNAKVMLVSSLAVAGMPDKNPLTLYVKKQVPEVQVPLHADFEGKVELVGYNIELPRDDSVGPGQTFHVNWIWRAKQGSIGAYQVFLHVDANDQRINGDHDPVDGKYPVRLWDEGDVIIDRQAISVPATSPAGSYTMFIGLFRGDSRLKVTQGPRDDADRVNAGTVRVQ